VAYNEQVRSRQPEGVGRAEGVGQRIAEFIFAPGVGGAERAEARGQILGVEVAVEPEIVTVVEVVVRGRGGEDAVVAVGIRAVG
jgi:hypothetical protein